MSLFMSLRFREIPSPWSQDNNSTTAECIGLPPRPARRDIRYVIHAGSDEIRFIGQPSRRPDLRSVRSLIFALFLDLFHSFFLIYNALADAFYPKLFKSEAEKQSKHGSLKSILG